MSNELAERIRACTDWQQVERAKGDVDLGGWLSPAENWALVELIRSLPANAVFFVLGLYKGAQLALARLLRDDIEVVGADSWVNDTELKIHGRHLEDCCRENLEKAGVRDSVEVITADSRELGVVWDRWLDVCMIDAGHEYVDAFEDLDNFSKWVKPGGFLLCDDLNQKDVYDAFHDWLALEQSGAWEIKIQWDTMDRTNKMWFVKRMRGATALPSPRAL